MAQSINLIPQEEKQEQVKAKLVKGGTIVSILLLIGVCGAAAYFFVQKDTLNSEISNLDQSILNSRSNIQDLSQIELSARKLDAKYKTLQSIFDSRSDYSLLLNELAKRIPTSVQVESLSFGSTGDSINISGTGSDYVSIAQFINTLSDPTFAAANKGLEELFTNVTLNTVSLDSQNGSAKYFIIVDINKGLLKR